MYQYKCTVVEITDGDTIKVNIDIGFNTWINNVIIRLQHVDAPESRTSDPIEKIYGLASKEFLKSILKQGNKYIIKTYIDDKYCRVLGEVYIETTLVSDLIIKEGYGVPYSGQSKAKLRDLHLANRARLLEEGKVVLPVKRF